MLKHVITFIILLTFISCGLSQKPPEPIVRAAVTQANCTAPQPITAIYREYVYGLAGYEYQAGGDAFNLFDENLYVDPKPSGNSNGYRPRTSPHPVRNHALYFKNGGSRIVVDLRIPYKLSEIYLFDRSNTADSVWIYTGTMQDWKLKAAITTGEGSGWRKLVVEDTTRYVQFRFSSSSAEITEAMMYGCPLAALPPAPPKEYTGPRLEPVTIKEFLGVNTYQSVPIKWLEPFYWTRLYTPLPRIDIDTADHYPNVRYYTTPDGWWNNGAGNFVHLVDSVNTVLKNKIWYSYLGVPRWMEKQGLNDKDRPVTKIGMDPEDPMSYARHANLMWTMAACYGTTKVDVAKINSVDPHRFSGKNWMTLYENGNEWDSDWLGPRGYCNPMEYFELSSADYDGHEGKMGAEFGIKKADQKSELMMAGLTSLNVDRVKILDFLCRTMRNDSQFLWKGGIQYHHYSYNGKGPLPGDKFASSTGGSTPEEDSLRIQLKRVRDATYLLQPGVPCIMGEYGFDKNRKSKTSTPLVPGFSQSESQGIMLLRSINAIAFSGFDRYIIYWIKDDSDESHEGQFLTSGVIRQINHQTHLPYPAWFYINTMVHHLGNYVPEKIISEQGNVWVYTYRNKTSPDSAAYYVYAPTRKGTKVNGYSLRTGGNSASELSFADKVPTGHVRKTPISGGVVKVDVSEMPKLIFVKEK